MLTHMVTHRPTNRKTFVAATPPTQGEAVHGFTEYLSGQRVYMARKPLEDCTNGAQRRGWQDALRYDAECVSFGREM